jgi:PAT family beta-lactamase induction signal transducer AmpG
VRVLLMTYRPMRVAMGPYALLRAGLPYRVAMTVSVVMYKTLGISNTDIALYTSWLYLPWVMKPLWSPVVELFGTKRGGSSPCSSPSAPRSRWCALTLPAAASSSVARDALAHGVQLGDARHRRRRLLHARPRPPPAGGFVGLRSAFWRVAAITGQGGVVYAAGELGDFTGDVAFAWIDRLPGRWARLFARSSRGIGCVPPPGERPARAGQPEPVKRS